VPTAAPALTERTVNLAFGKYEWTALQNLGLRVLLSGCYWSTPVLVHAEILLSVVFPKVFLKTFSPLPVTRLT
jgi:hypothetical protein